jgi:hypothetical protein
VWYLHSNRLRIRRSNRRTWGRSSRRPSSARRNRAQRRNRSSVQHSRLAGRTWPEAPSWGFGTHCKGRRRQTRSVEA